MFSVALAALIPLGAGIDRWRLAAICSSTALLAGWTYPLFAHWVWGGGWLAQLGVNYGLGHGFVDAGGAGSIQVLGGLTALAIAWILGPRRASTRRTACRTRFPAITPSWFCSAACWRLLGWLGLNSAGAILFTGKPARRNGTDRHQYNACGGRGRLGGRGDHARAIWPAGCLADRQRLG